METVYDGLGDEQFLALMREAGFSGSLVPVAGGRHCIKATMGDLWFVVYFFNGAGETTPTVASCVAFLDYYFPLAFHNQWNRVHLFPKSSAGSRGEVVLEMNLVLRGVTSAYVKRNLQIWHNAVTLYLQEASAYFSRQPELDEAVPGGEPGT